MKKYKEKFDDNKIIGEMRNEVDDNKIIGEIRNGEEMRKGGEIM